MRQPEFRHLCTYNADIEVPHLIVGDGPFGARRVGQVLGGTVSGDRLRGKVLPGGADWALVKDDVLRLDVRLNMQTHDDAIIYLTYTGIIHPYVPDLRQILASGELAQKDFYFRTIPTFETGDARYTWLNDRVFFGIGGLGDDGVHYDVFELM